MGWRKSRAGHQVSKYRGKKCRDDKSWEEKYWCEGGKGGSIGARSSGVESVGPRCEGKRGVEALAEYEREKRGDWDVVCEVFNIVIQGQSLK